MSMSRADYEGIAKVLKSWKVLDAFLLGNPHSLLCEDMADYLATTNPLFDRDKFIKACGA